MEVFAAGAWRDITRAEVYVGGTWRRIVRGEVYKDGAWRSIASFIPPLSLSVTPYVQGGANPAKPSRLTVTTSYAQATPSGGTAPYSYAWTAGGVTITNPANSSTAFTASLGNNQEIYATATVTCTDANGNTVVGQCDYYLYNQSNQ